MGRTFIVEVCFNKAPENTEQAAYIRASLEEGISLLWHDYMANEKTAPQHPVRVTARQRRTAAHPSSTAPMGGK